MQSKLIELVDKYHEITKEQTKVIASNDIESLNKLIELKNKIILQVRKELEDVETNSLSSEIKDKMKRINNLEKKNIEHLKSKQKEVSQQASVAKNKSEALKGYGKQK